MVLCQKYDEDFNTTLIFGPLCVAHHPVMSIISPGLFLAVSPAFVIGVCSSNQI